jgi:hypothetical protein
MAEIVNLKRARKAAARRDAEAAAAANRVRFGLGAAERARMAAEADKARQTLDGHKREP